MKVFAFHLMPYRHLDMAAAEKFRSSFIMTPNDMYDVRRGAALYHEYLDQLTLAADLGFDGVCVNEHHQASYGLMPAPNLLASILIDRTRGKDTRVGVLGRALPLVKNPVFIAEEYAMLDNLSNGRLIAGFVRGIGPEYFSSGVNPADSHKRFHEAHDLIVRAWTETGPFAYEGDQYDLDYINCWPRVVQKPHPPIWIPSQGSAETIEWAAHPSRKYPFIVTFTPVETVLRNHSLYKQRAEQFGYQATGEQLGWAIPTYVAETDEIAMRESEAHIEALFNVFLKIPPELLFPPGYTSIASYNAIMKARQGMAFVRQTLKDYVDKGTFLVGSPQTVIDKIAKVNATSGVKNLICMVQFGTLPDELVRKNIQMLSEEVLPKIRGL